MAALRLLLALAPLACALTSQPAPLFQNLRLEPNELRLSWDGHVTSGPRDVLCQKGAGPPEWAPAHRTYCTFTSLSLCHVTEFSVSLYRDRSSTARIRFPESDPDRASAATNLTCWVHDVDVMTCRWGRGPAAPRDAQYRMFWRRASHGRDQDRECAHYDLTDARGARLGCRVDGVAALPTHVTVTVTGGGGASCTDVSMDLQRAEVLTPPALTAACNGTEAAQLRWEMRSHFHRGFEYQLQINKSSRLEPEIEKTSESHFRVLIPGSASFRVRAKPTSSPRFSEWSRPVRLDCAPAGTGNRVTVMAAALAALGAGLAALATLLLCRRPLRTKLFPPIPRVKDPGPGEETETVTWTAAPEDPEVTRVTEA
ncbi:interleukin-3 receptor subunit alpha-like [Chionomys nivalis]|uniref:interleukin-3 receptor subunit alpha-like n=1 Tax=Chionomys nivalis TaxID=269649 RepID=UPI0025968220|nr:interleukin-3 receptor subunit alpha-like [Chionomys nivalis]